MKFHKKGISTVGEFIILIGIILVSALFFMSFQKTITQEAGVAREMGVKTIGERISGLMTRIESEPSYTVQTIKVPQTTVKVKNGILTIEREGKTFSESVPENSRDVFLNDTLKVVIEKRDGEIFLSSEVPVCNHNLFCEPKECLYDCEDCYGPDDVCIGDGNCTKAIGETCKNSPADCACENGKECCPSHPDSDEHSCLNITEKGDEGKECYCDNQCSDNLKCNPTQDKFNGFEKACCSPGKGWDGDECVKLKKFVLVFVQVNSKVPNLKTLAERSKDDWVDRTYLKNCPGVVATETVSKVCNTQISASVTSTMYNNLRNCVRSAGYGNKYTRIVGIKPGSVFNLGGISAKGFTNKGSDVVFATSASVPNTVTHELGHTFGLCDIGYGGGSCSQSMCSTGFCASDSGGLSCKPGSYCCPNYPLQGHFTDIYCSKDLCNVGCSDSPDFTNPSREHLKGELKKYC